MAASPPSPGHKPLLSQPLAKQMISEQMPGWGLGVELKGTGAASEFGHAGDNEGYSCQFSATAAPGPVIAIMTASNVGQQVISPLMATIRDLLKWPGAAAVAKGGPPVVRVKPLPSAGELALLPMLYGGDYKISKTGLRLTLEGTGWNWTLTLPGQEPLPLEVKSAEWAVCPVLPVELSFDLDPATHAATGLTLRMIGDRKADEIKATRA
jgi:hypothetical protein